MTSVTQVLKSMGPKLVPFFKTVAVYFVLFIPHDKPSLFSAVIKCLPIISLMLFVLLHGMSLGEQHKYSRRILSGLIFCCIGDALLIWPNYFEIGIVCFAIGHLYYIKAFGFEPLNPILAIVLYTINIAAIIYLMPGLHGILMPGVVIYTFLVTTMTWRAIAQVQFFQDLWTWSKFCTCAGGMLFAASDFLIGVDKFMYNIDYAQVVIMSTYYAAQLGIVISVVDATTQNRVKEN